MDVEIQESREDGCVPKVHESSAIQGTSRAHLSDLATSDQDFGLREQTLSVEQTVGSEDETGGFRSLGLRAQACS